MRKQGDAQWLGIKLKRMMTGTLSPPSRTTCAYNAHLSCFSSSFLPRAMQNHLNTLHVRHEVRRTWARWCWWIMRNEGRTRNSLARQGRFPLRIWQSRARRPRRHHIRCRQVHGQRAAHHVVCAGSHAVAALGYCNGTHRREGEDEEESDKDEPCTRGTRRGGTRHTVSRSRTAT